MTTLHRINNRDNLLRLPTPFEDGVKAAVIRAERCVVLHIPFNPQAFARLAARRRVEAWSRVKVPRRKLAVRS